MSPVSETRTRWSAARKERVGRAVFVVCVLLIIAGLIAYGILAMPKDYWPAFVACVLGALLAIAELVARYRDDPAAAVLSWPAAVYVGVNATAAGMALYVIHVFGWTFGANGSALVAVQVLTAGLGSAALFRASVFNVTAGDRVIGIGPSEILNVILTAADRAVDRRRALIRATRAAQIMKGLTFEKSAEALLAFCIATMQNVTPDEAKVVEDKISTLRDRKNDGVHDTVKLYILGLALLSLVGDHVLEKASDQLRVIFEEALPPHAQDGTGSSLVPPTVDKRTEVLQTLKENAGAMPLYDLRSQVRLGLTESYIIDELQQEGLVSIRGSDGSETIEMAAAGPNGHAPAGTANRAANAAAGEGPRASTPYFAYGSNMAPGEISQWCPQHRYVGVASLPDHRLAFTRKSRNGYGVADIVEEPGREVWGVLYELSADDLVSLDRKEGLGRAYEHVDVCVRLEADGAERTAKAYTVISKESPDVPTSREYLRRVTDAAYARRLPGRYLAELQAIPTGAPHAERYAADDTEHARPMDRPARRSRGG
jgi:gamma-glutamylcyclotransferase (GGCT)/AIG2-like uncharacterized protein YtfP